MEWIRRNRWWLSGVILIGGLSAWFYFNRARSEHSQDKVIMAAAQRYDVAPTLIKAVMWRESRFKPNAKGAKGEVGLMQLREDAAREWANAEKLNGFDHLQMFHPVRNTMAGTWYLRQQLRRYSRTDNPVPYALAAYNAGASNVARWTKDKAATNSAAFIKSIGFASTQHYVQSVLQRQEQYFKEFGHGFAHSRQKR